MFRLQVTIIRQTFHYMDMTCSVLQYGFLYCKHWTCQSLCTEMCAWWWLLVTETCSELHIIEYIVVFWLNDNFGCSNTWDIMKAKHSYRILGKTHCQLRLLFAEGLLIRFRRGHLVNPQKAWLHTECQLLPACYLKLTYISYEFHKIYFAMSNNWQWSSTFMWCKPLHLNTRSATQRNKSLTNTSAFSVI